MNSKLSAKASDIPILDIDRVSMRFGGLVAVTDLDLDVSDGQFVVLAGSEGAGKTTVCDCISGECEPTNGSVRFRGRRLTRSFGPGVFWMAISIGLITGLLAAAAAVDIDRLWLAVVRRGMVFDRSFTFDSARRRLRSYFRAELALDRLAGKWRVVSADGRDVLVVCDDFEEAKSLKNQLQAAVTARRIGPSTVPNTSDMADAAEPSQRQLPIPDDTLNRLAAGKSRIRIRGWSALLAGWIIGATGVIVIWSRSRGSLHIAARAGIARTFQNPRLFENMTVRENVLVALDRMIPGGSIALLLRTPANHRGEQHAHIKANKILKFVGLGSMADHLACDTSLLDRKRLEIARALATGADLILLDEPMAGLDEKGVAVVMELLHRMKDQGLTLLMTSGSLSFPSDISDKVVVLDRGVKIAEGALTNVRHDLRVKKRPVTNLL